MSNNSILNALRLAANGLATLFTKNQTIASPIQDYGSSVSLGALILSLDDPFAGLGVGITTYETFGTVPNTLALNGNRVLVGSLIPSSNTTYEIGILATSGDGKRAIGDTIKIVTKTVVQPATLLANPAPASPVISTFASSTDTGYINTGLKNHFIEGDVTQNWILTALSDIDGKNAIEYTFRNGDHFAVAIYENGARTELSWKPYVLYPGVGSRSKLRLEATNTGDLLLKLNDTIVPDSIVNQSNFGNKFAENTYTRLRMTSSQIAQNVKTGAIVPNYEPIVVNSNVIVDSKAAFDINYYIDASDIFQCQLEDVSGTVLSAWTDMSIVTNLTPGSAVLRSPQTIPSTGSVFAKIRQKNKTSVNTSVTLRAADVVLAKQPPVPAADFVDTTDRDYFGADFVSPYHFIQIKTGDKAWVLTVAADRNFNNGWVYNSVSTNTYSIQKKTDGQFTDYKRDLQMPAAVDGGLMKLSRRPDGSVALYRDNVLIEASVIPADTVALNNPGNSARYQGFYGSRTDQVTYGVNALVYDKLKINNTSIVGGKVVLDINYVTPTADSYQARFETASGEVLNDWFDTTVLTNTVAGSATLQTTQAAPASARGASFVTVLRQRNAITVQKKVTVGYPITEAIYTIVSTITKNEGNSGLTEFVFPVVRDLSSDVGSIGWKVIAGTATANDFDGDVLPSGTLSFPVGVTQKDIVVKVKADTVIEADETFTVEIKDLIGNAGIKTSTGTILNDDVAATAKLLANPGTIVSPPTVFPNTTKNTGLIDVGTSHYVQATAGDVAWQAKLSSDAAGRNLVTYFLLNSNYYAKGYIKDGVQTTFGGNLYMPTRSNANPGLIKAVKNTDGSTALYVDNVLLDNSIIPASYLKSVGIIDNNYASIEVGYGGSFSDISVGSIANTPVRINSANVVNSKVEMDIKYYIDSETTYQIQIEDEAGTVLTAWADIEIVTNTTAGLATIRSSQSTPAIGRIVAKVRQKDITGNATQKTLDVLPTIVIAMAGSSSPAGYLTGFAGTENSNVRLISGTTASTLKAGKFGMDAGNAIYAATSRGVDYIGAGVGGTTLTGWVNNQSNVRGNLTTAILTTGRCDYVLLQIGYNDLGGGTINSVSERAGLIRSLISKIRTESKLADLKFIIGGTQDRTDDAVGVDVQRRAELLVANTDANVYYGFSTFDLETTDGTHQNAASMGISALRFADQLLAIRNNTTQKRGSYIASAAKVSNTQTDVRITYRVGTDFTPVTGITGMVITDSNGNKIAVTDAVRQNANTIRVTHASISGLTVKIAYMPNAGAPDNATIVRDNSTRLLPMEPTVDPVEIVQTSSTSTTWDDNATWDDTGVWTEA